MSDKTDKKLPIRLIPKKRKSLTESKSDSKTDDKKYIKEDKLTKNIESKEPEIIKKDIPKLLPKFNPVEKDFTKATYDPNDTGMELSVIKINIEGVDYNFLLGRTNNLYTYDKDNELIGKVDIVDEKRLNIYLCEGWRERL